MEAVSHLAAARGDPYLYNDLPCMLTLMVLVRDLADLYQDQWGALGQLSSREEFSAAPIAACAMVLDEFEVDDESIKTMLRALENAFQQLSEAHVFGAERLPVQRAWDAALEKNSEQQRACLRQAAAIYR